MGERIFRPRVDVWLVLLVGGACIAPLVLAGWFVWQGRSDGVLFLALWSLAVSATVLVLTLPVRYKIGADHLFVQSGWLKWEIPLAAVRRVRPTWSPLAGPAWSLRRILIEWSGDGFILVSPDDRESFMHELAARCPHLVRTGAGLEFRPPSP